MKKLLLTAAAVFAFGFANAQDSSDAAGKGYAKGNVFITGSVGIGSEKTGNEKANSFDFSPKAGYLVTNNIAVGLALGVQSGKDDNGVNTINKTNTFSVGAFGRYFFTPASQFSLFGELGFNINSTKNTNEVTVGNTTTKTENKSNGFGIALAPGVNYFLSKHFALEASWGILSYGTTKPDVAGAKSTDDFNFGLNLNPFAVNNLGGLKLGLTYKF